MFVDKPILINTIIRLKKTRNRGSWLILMIAPLLLFFTYTWLHLTDYENEIFAKIDPDYAFLISSIDSSEFDRTYLGNHPGSTIQAMSFLIMQLAHIRSEWQEEPIEISVLKNPVYYLKALNATFAYLNIFVVLITGILVYHATNQLVAGLLIQLTPFLSSHLITYGLRGLTAEVFLFSASLLMIFVIIKYLYLPQTKRKLCIYPILMGIISGFGLGTKFVFIILMPMPIIMLPSLRKKFVFLISTIISFVAFTLPVLGSYSWSYRFLKKIFLHTGIYGSGERGIIDLEIYGSSLYRILSQNPAFFGILIIAIITVILCLVFSKNSIVSMKNIKVKLLSAIVITDLFAIFLVAKHYKSKYLLPALCLSGISIYLIFIILNGLQENAKVTEKTKKRFKFIMYVAISTLTIFAFCNTLMGIGRYRKNKKAKIIEVVDIQEKINKEFKGYGIIYFYQAPLKIFALEFGNLWMRGFYSNSLKMLYGDQYFYHVRGRFVHGWDKKNKIPFEKIKNKYGNRIIMVGSPFHRFKPKLKRPDFKLTECFGGKYFTIYCLQN
jgi:hypothetical protein